MEERYGPEALLDELEVGVMVIGRGDGKMYAFNRRVCRDLFRRPEELQDKHYKDIFWPEFVTLYEGLVEKCWDGNEHTAIYYWAARRMWEQISARHILWENRQPALLLSITNITEVARSEYKYENLAYFDNVLKLPNGLKLEEDINELASVETVALIYMEVARLDDINELYGVNAGDYLLRSIRDWLLNSETRRAQVYRLNDGFAILGRGVHMDDARDRAAEILRRFQKAWPVPTSESFFSIFCKVKVGIVYGKYVKDEMRNLLLRTIRMPVNDMGYAVYDDAIDRAAQEGLRLRETLISCVLNDMEGFSVVFQPIVQVSTRRWVGLEALCRWVTPEGQPVSPLQFIHIAEKLGLIKRLDDWVWQTAMRHCVRLGLTEKKFHLDVNFSPTQKISEEFVEKLSQTMRELDYPPQKLNIEITESTKMQFDAENVAGLRQLAKKGVIFSLDDFGTGYSSIENLIKLPVSILKTEKLFLDGIEQDDYRQYLLKMLIDLAHHLDMKLIAEGVETEEQIALVSGFGADLVQGYFFSRPLTVDQLKEKLDRFEDAET